MVLHLNKFESPSLKDALCQTWLKFAQQFWRWRFLNSVNVFLLLRHYLSLVKGWALHLNKLESSLPKEVLHQVWPSGSREEDLFNFVNVFLLFPNYWRNLNPLHPRILCAKFGWNWPCGSGEEDKNVNSLRQCQRQHDGQ